MAYPHWEYFLAIEDDLTQCARYVEFSRVNYSVYSIEFARLLLAAASEFDVVAKMLCKKIAPNNTPNNINDYRAIILRKYAKFPDVEINVPRHGLSLHPWGDWISGQNPAWWRSYNVVKHERNQYFKDATLEKALLAIAGLLCGLMYYYKEEIGNQVALDPAPQLLEPKHYGWGEPASISWTYEIPDNSS